MSLFVYVTDSCREDAKSHGLSDELERLCAKVEEHQHTSQFDRFPKPYIVKKKLGGRQGRLIAEEYTLGEHLVIVCLAIMIRGSREYNSGFGHDPVAYGSQRFRGLYEPGALEAYVRDRVAQSPVKEKPAPTDEEYGLLYGALASSDASTGGRQVYETREWVQRVAQEDIAIRLVQFAKPALEALAGPEGLSFFAIEGKPGWGVWVYRGGDKIVLMAPSTETTSAQVERIVGELAARFDRNGPVAILQESRRAYPEIVLADEDLWIAVEREREANLALSPEESKVLESARSAEGAFPLFINGRAGSGKSTILQYLFATYLHNYCAGGAATEVEPPIYLTANADLLRVARQTVERLLKKELDLAGAPAGEEAGGTQGVVGRAFREFYDFVGSLIRPDARRIQFAPAKRLQYAGFRSQWMVRFGKDPTALRDFGPDVSWHVIRTYIKGRSSEDFLDAEDYAQLSESERSVTQETYAYVYERVWNGWYEPLCRNEGYWDDQDLVRYVLDKDLAKRKFPAVFCDEAQDFTRLELELLLRINLFSERSVSGSDLGRVCFVFAGDQFQTLNPTGFRWDAIKATFVEKFILELDPSRRSGRMDLNYRELEYNYRSSRRIVRFSNHVQALRAALFAIPDLKPQTPWLSEPREFPVVAFQNNDGTFWKRFRENAGWIVIVPCADGEELSYVQGDPVLREYIRIEDGVPGNVLSAARAKGCEYADVIVYGFGDASAHAVMVVLEDDAFALSVERRLPLEYFINRVYVAVSRAKRRLAIVDTQKGFEQLWAPACDESNEATMLRRIKNGESVWRDSIEGLRFGLIDELAKDTASDPVENAEAFERDGLVRRDGFLMRQASQSYRAGGNQVKAKECRARALEFEQQLVEAGAAFAECGLLADAVRCYWAAGKPGWEPLIELQAAFPKVESELEFRIARGLAKSLTVGEAIGLMGTVMYRCEDSKFADAIAGSSVWREAMGALLRPAFSLEAALGGKPAERRSTASRDEAVRMAELLRKAREAGLIIAALDAAAVYYRAEQYAEAAREWESAGSTSSTEYMTAKAYSEVYPKSVGALARLKAWTKIVEAFRQQPDVALTPDQVRPVIEALAAVGSEDEAIGLGWQLRSGSGMLDVAKAATGAGNAAAALQALHAWVAIAVSDGDWESVLKVLPGAGPAVGGDPSEASVFKLLDVHRDALCMTMIRAFARNGDLKTAPQATTRKITEFLRKTLTVSGGHWHPLVSVDEAGAAIERGGQHTDAVRFYEALRAASEFDEYKSLARKRLLVAQWHQLTLKKLQGESGQTRQMERDLKQRLAGLGLKSIDDLDRFPPLAKLELGGLGKPVPKSDTSVDTIERPVLPPQEMGPSTVALPQTAACRVGDYEVEVSRAAGRVNIKHGPSLETAFVKLKSGECGGEGGIRKAGDGAFVVAQWGVQVLRRDQGIQAVEIVVEKLGAKVIVDL